MVGRQKDRAPVGAVISPSLLMGSRILFRRIELPPPRFRFFALPLSEGLCTFKPSILHMLLRAMEGTSAVRRPLVAEIVWWCAKAMAPLVEALAEAWEEVVGLGLHLGGLARRRCGGVVGDGVDRNGW
jgi:hypothetical protein